MQNKTEKVLPVATTPSSRLILRAQGVRVFDLPPSSACSARSGAADPLQLPPITAVTQNSRTALASRTAGIFSNFRSTSSGTLPST
jgi:hypothetical protein